MFCTLKYFTHRVPDHLLKDNLPGRSKRGMGVSSSTSDCISLFEPLSLRWKTSFLPAVGAVVEKGVTQVAKRKSIDTTERAIQASIDVTTLQGLLPTNQKLEINEKVRIVNVLAIDPPRLLAQQQFTKSEWCVLLTLLTSYPHYAPYEALLACLTSLSLDDCRARILEAQEIGPQELNRELKPVQRALSGIRTKLNGLTAHLKISVIRESGYALTTCNKP